MIKRGAGSETNVKQTNAKRNVIIGDVGYFGSESILSEPERVVSHS